MGFLQRSKSAGVKDLRGRRNETQGHHPDIPLKTELEKRSISRERPKTAERDRQRSFSRPRTAGASTERRSDFQPTGPTIDIKAGDDIFSFPTPSPRLPPPKSATFHNTKSPLAGIEESPQIGVAIGSPREMPTWGRSMTADHISKRIPVQPPPERNPPPVPWKSDDALQRPELPKKKGSWKAFGGLFVRKPVKPAVEEPFYKLQLWEEQHEEMAARSRHLNRLSPATSPMTGQHATTPHQRSPSITRNQARLEARAQADLANISEQKPKKIRSPSMIQKEGFSFFTGVPRKSEDMFRPEGEGRNDSPLSMNEKTDAPPTVSTPKLDLNLPDPKFERYSVMFEKLLEEPKMSLLERRQSKLQRTKSIKTIDTSTSEPDGKSNANLEVNSVPQRSATSPHLKKSLSIRIGKKVLSPVNEAFTAIHRPRPVQRSNTAPPGATSPMAKEFTKPKIAVLSEDSETEAGTGTGASLPPTPMTITTLSDSDSVAILNDNLLGVQHQRMTQSEPNWDMLTSQPPSKSGEERRSPNPYHRVKSPADLEKQIVQVSVARQVSVSKARRQVSQAVDSKQPLKPRVVELSKNRKSTVVLIEGGDD